MYVANPDKHPRLYLPMPEGVAWQVLKHGPNLMETIVDDNVVIQVRAMVAPTIEHTLWVEGLMLERATPGSTLVRKSLVPQLSTRGWPVVVAHYEVFGPDGKLEEERAGAFYRIVHNRAEVMVRMRNGVTWKQREAELLPVLLAAHVEWPDAQHDMIYTQLGYTL